MCQVLNKIDREGSEATYTPLLSFLSFLGLVQFVFSYILSFSFFLVSLLMCGVSAGILRNVQHIWTYMYMYILSI